MNTTISPAAETALMMLEQFNVPRLCKTYGVDDAGVCLCREGPDCDCPGKHPVGGVNKHVTSKRAIIGAGAKYNWSIPLASMVIGVDDDTTDHTGFDAVENAISAKLPHTATIRTGSDHRTRLYRSSEPMPLRIGLLKTPTGNVDIPPMVVLPGSRSRGAYAWDKSPIDMGLATLPPKLADFILTNQKDETQNSKAGKSETQNGGNETQNNSCVSSKPLHVSRQFCVSDIERLIRRCIPDQHGLRWHCLFRMSRGLRGLPEFAECSQQDLEPVLREWHRRAERFIATKDINVSRRDLWEGYKRVRFAGGTQGRLATMVDVAFAEQSLQTRLEHLCAALQQSAGDGPFYLACRAAAEVLGASHVTVSRIMRLMVVEGKLELVEQGKRRRAAEYRWIGGKETE